MSPRWNPDDYNKKPAVRRFVRELMQLVDEYAPHVFLDTGQTSLMIKGRRLEDPSHASALLEYWPEPGKKGDKEGHLFVRKTAHDEIPVPEELGGPYRLDVQRYGKPVEDANINLFIGHLRRICEALYSENRSIDQPGHQLVRTTDYQQQEHGFYLPNQEDFENARRKCLREGNKRVSIDDVLEIVEKNIKEAGHKLSQDWRSVTEEHIEIWLERKG